MIEDQHLPRGYACGNLVFASGASGPLWQLAEGVIALQSASGEQGRLVQLAGAGDWLGVEALFGLPYRFEARAFTDCRLLRVDPPTDSARERLLYEALLQQQQRSMEMTDLRTGPVYDRLQQLLRLLGHPEDRSASPSMAQTVRRTLPPLGDLARVVDASRETVCRALSQLLPRPRIAHGSAMAFALAA